MKHMQQNLKGYYNLRLLYTRPAINPLVSIFYVAINIDGTQPKYLALSPLQTV